VSVQQIKTKNFSCHTADSKPVKQEVNGTVVLPPLVFPGLGVSDEEESLVTSRPGGTAVDLFCLDRNVDRFR
jgi:hypothetical protein